MTSDDGRWLPPRPARPASTSAGFTRIVARVAVILAALPVGFYAFMSSLGTTEVGYGWVSAVGVLAALAAGVLACTRHVVVACGMLVLAVGAVAAATLIGY